MGLPQMAHAPPSACVEMSDGHGLQGDDVSAWRWSWCCCMPWSGAGMPGGNRF